MNWVRVTDDINGVKSSNKDAYTLFKGSKSVLNTEGTDNDADENDTNIK